MVETSKALDGMPEALVSDTAISHNKLWIPAESLIKHPEGLHAVANSSSAAHGQPGQNG